MPRKKMAGAAPPKSRSRRGCWPCKSRKVKCDEINYDVPGGRGPCQACQRLGQECDYRLRLNWEGRGKKVQDGLLNFSSTNISVSGGPAPTADPPAPPAPESLQQMVVFTAGPIPAMPLSTQNSHAGPSTMQATPSSPATHAPNQTAHGSQVFLMQEPPHPTQSFLSDRPSSDLLAIDPALTGAQSPTASMFPSGRFGSSYRPSQHTESWERRREDGPSTPKPAPLSSRPRPVTRPTEHLSPSDSGAPSPTASNYSTRSATLSGLDSPVSPPPYADGGNYAYPASRRHVGVRTQVGSAYGISMPPPAPITHFSHQNQSPSNGHIDGRGNSTSNPSTPGSSHSDDAFQNYGQSSSHVAPDSGVRRMSVRSLLSDAPRTPRSLPRSIPEITQDMFHDCTVYGVDRGIKDLDIPNNDDKNALSGASPVAKRAHLELVVDSPGNQTEFGFGVEEHNATSPTGGYYSNGPVQVSIPNIFHPLPPRLLENPMLILYFHHFLNHTAKCLIPHNCASNPFLTILPFMAMQDWNLLILILVYSMCHRARLLGQPEPATRIALLVQGVFAGLRRALDDPSQIITNANLATAIMLASLEIVSPSAFGVTVPWQTHLDIARQMVSMRGGPKGMRTESRTDNVSSFLWSWFAYLDVLGSLSGGKDSPSSSWVLDYHVEGDTDYEIDCVLGFSSKCIRILAKISALARVCDNERLAQDIKASVDWIPSKETLKRAEELDAELRESRLAPSTPCNHMQSAGESHYHWDSVEMGATNEAFHWAGHIHLHRRILGKPSAHPDVQNAVRQIFGDLYKVRRGSNAEGCLLFPMFTAGCETQDERLRVEILDRMKGVERLGMTQVHRARTLMERVWQTGKPWETLVAGEFFG